MRWRMWNVIHRGLRARKVRLLLTALSVLLGVGFVTGVFVLTDTLRSSFDRVFGATALDVDLVVRARGIPGATEQERMHDQVVADVREVPGIAAADGVVQGIAKIQGADGEIVQTGLAPTIGVSWPTQEGVGPVRLVEDGRSRAPTGDGEVAVDAITAAREGFVVGDAIGVQVGAHPLEHYTVVGIFELGDLTSLAGATFVAFDVAVAQEGFEAVGLVNHVNVRLEPGIASVDARERILSTLGFGFEVLDAQQAAEELGEPLQEGLGLLERLLLAFAAVGVFVGAFIIFNTFSVLVSQRTRELGLLRSLGATNRQVVVGVLLEALAVGTVAAILGLVVGVGLAWGLLAAFPDVGFEVPDGPIVVGARTLVVGMAVGIVVTVAAALVPALRAARVPPVVARGHTARASTVGSLTRRSATGVALLAVGGGLVAFGLGRGGLEIELQVGAVAIGLFTVFLAVVLVAPAISRLLVPVLASLPAAVLVATAGAVVAAGALMRLVGVFDAGSRGAPAVLVPVALAGVVLLGAVPTMRGVLATLTRGNAARNPRRTTATASALVLGLTLVCLVAILLSSVRLSLQSGIEEGVDADVVLSASDFTPISPQAVEDATTVPGVEGYAELRFAYGGVAGRSELIAGINPDAFEGVVALDVREGSPARIREGMLVSSLEADRLGVRAGDLVEVAFSGFAGTASVPVVGVYENRNFTGSVLVDFIVSQAAFVAGFGESTPATLAFLRTTPGRGDATRGEIAEMLEIGYPDVRVHTVGEFQGEQDRSIDLVVNVLLALLLFSMLIAVLGIVNTLFLSVHERTRELGLLRTLGMLPHQVRRMVRGEAIVIAGIGCVLGALLGLLWGWGFTRALGDEGVTRLSIPVAQLAVFVVLAAAAGVVASIAPAWRASRLDVLEAVAEE